MIYLVSFLRLLFNFKFFWYDYDFDDFNFDSFVYKSHVPGNGTGENLICIPVFLYSCIPVFLYSCIMCIVLTVSWNRLMPSLGIQLWAVCGAVTYYFVTAPAGPLFVVGITIKTSSKRQLCFCVRCQYLKRFVFEGIIWVGIIFS